MKRKKRKRYYIPVNLFPRIMKNDIRRSYSQMMVNSFNSCSEHMMQGFLATYATSDCHMIRFAPHAVISNVPNIQYVEGISNIVSVFQREINACPDVVVRLTNCAILPHRDPNEGSKVICDLEMKYTKVFSPISSIESKELLEMHKNQIHYCGHLPTTTSTPCASNSHFPPDSSPNAHWIVSETSTEMDSSSILPPDITSANSLSTAGIETLIDQINHLKVTMEPCVICSRYTEKIQYARIPKPVTYIRSSRVTMYLDKDYRMYRMEVNAANAPQQIYQPPEPSSSSSSSQPPSTSSSTSSSSS